MLAARCPRRAGALARGVPGSLRLPQASPQAWGTRRGLGTPDAGAPWSQRQETSLGGGLELCMPRSRNRIGMTPECGGGESFVNNLRIPFPAPTCSSWTSPAAAPASSRIWISVRIAAQSCLYQGLRIQSSVLAVASPSTCEVRGSQAAAPAGVPAWKGRRLGEVQVSSIGVGREGGPGTNTFRLGRNLKARM